MSCGCAYEITPNGDKRWFHDPECTLGPPDAVVRDEHGRLMHIWHKTYFPGDYPDAEKVVGDYLLHGTRTFPVDSSAEISDNVSTQRKERTMYDTYSEAAAALAETVAEVSEGRTEAEVDSAFPDCVRLVAGDCTPEVAAELLQRNGIEA